MAADTLDTALSTADMASDPRMCDFLPGNMGRGILETVYSLPGRVWRRARLENMTRKERDFAFFSKEMYVHPNQRRVDLRGYALLKGSTDDLGVRLNATRWGVYRAPNGIDHVLAFRGTADSADTKHDLDLVDSGFGEHPLIMDAAVWSSRVMLFLSKKRREASGANDSRLVFKVAGHSLGGALAMGVVSLLYDVPAVALRLEKPSQSRVVLNVFKVARYSLVGAVVFVVLARLPFDEPPDVFKVVGFSLAGALAIGIISHLPDVPFVDFGIEQASQERSPHSDTFQRDIAEPWAAAAAVESTLPFELSGGHIFNPGSFNRMGVFDPGDLFRYMGIGTSVTAAYMSAEAFTAGLAGGGFGKAAVGPSTCFAMAGMMAFACVFLFGLTTTWANSFSKRGQGGDDRADKLVTTHHILGDVVSCSFRMGNEKDYLAKSTEYGAHSIRNFIE